MVANYVQVDADTHPQQDLLVANEPGLGLVERSNTLRREVLFTPFRRQPRSGDQGGGGTDVVANRAQVDDVPTRVFIDVHPQ